MTFIFQKNSRGFSILETLIYLSISMVLGIVIHGKFKDIKQLAIDTKIQSIHTALASSIEQVYLESMLHREDFKEEGILPRLNRSLSTCHPKNKNCSTDRVNLVYGYPKPRIAVFLTINRL